jgi:hypothetical protein
VEGHTFQRWPLRIWPAAIILFRYRSCRGFYSLVKFRPADATCPDQGGNHKLEGPVNAAMPERLPPRVFPNDLSLRAIVEAADSLVGKNVGPGFEATVVRQALFSSRQGAPKQFPRVASTCRLGPWNESLQRPGSQADEPRKLALWSKTDQPEMFQFATAFRCRLMED